MTNLSGSYEEMSVEKMRNEIIRLRGEVSSACWSIAFLYKCLFRFGGDDLRSLFIDKIRDSRPDEVSLALLGNRWVEGIDRFNERLVKHISDNFSNDTSVQDDSSLCD